MPASNQFHDALRPERPYGLLGTGSPGRPPRLSHSSWALPSSPCLLLSIVHTPKSVTLRHAQQVPLTLLIKSFSPPALQCQTYPNQSGDCSCPMASAFLRRSRCMFSNRFFSASASWIRPSSITLGTDVVMNQSETGHGQLVSNWSLKSWR